MSTKPENPQAFPEANFSRVGDVSLGTTNNGMTLRDYFASAIMNSCAGPHFAQCVEGYNEGKLDFPGLIKSKEIIANFCFSMADAMLIARAK